MEKLKRDTNADLMNNVFALVKNAHCYDKAEEIMDYFLPEKYEITELSDYNFDFETNLCFGGNEGIYLDCRIAGHFNENAPCNQKQAIPCGTFKTLGTSLEAMRIMGELAGSLVYFARKYVNENIDKYTPLTEREEK